MRKNLLKTACVTLAAVMAAAGLPMTAAAAQEPAAEREFCIGSISKMYVTAAALQLVDQGLVELDAPVADYLPDFRMADARYKDITVRMLMNHKSGLMGTTGRDAFLLGDSDRSFEDGLLSYLEVQRLKADPGDFSTYCNDGFDLLQQVVEQVSGEDFTDYVQHHIAAPLGLEQTGTSHDRFQNEAHVTCYGTNNRPMTADYAQAIGAGGIVSTAREVARFGSAFFRGNNLLFSEKAKNASFELQCEDRAEGGWGLGWDFVDLYGDQVKVVVKGGDLMNQHGSLLVAPEEEISIAALTSGGSSTVAELFSIQLLDVILEDRGIAKAHAEVPEFTLVDTIPEEYHGLEGIYGTNCSLIRLTIRGDYLEVVDFSPYGTDVTNFKYTEEGSFVKVLGDVANGICVQDSDVCILEFKERSNGRTYLTMTSNEGDPEIHDLWQTDYYAERVETAPLSDSLRKTWEQRDGRYYQLNEKYSSMNYLERPSLEVGLADPEADLFFAGVLMQVRDENHAVSFLQLPGGGGRDLTDITFTTVDGKEMLVDDLNGVTYIREDDIPELPEDLTEVQFTKREAVWYTLGKNMRDHAASFTLSDKTAVYVYDRYDHVIYSSYMTGYGTRIPLLPGGKIVFLGEPGEHIGMELSK